MLIQCYQLLLFMLDWLSWQVERSIVLPDGQSLEDAERGGFIYFVLSDNVNVPQVQIQMPFIQLKHLNDALAADNNALFPSHFLFYPSPTRKWRWQDFEAMMPYLVLFFARLPFNLSNGSFICDRSFVGP